jgi:HD-GYP domain-containing protein (c-di-GMP phosphodiesterase class II)
MLRAAANLIKSCCRQEDIVARWGGDEYVILLPKTDAAAADEVCRRIERQCSGEYVGDIPLSISLGSASKIYSSQELVKVLREAEDNMYKNKLAESRSARSAVLSALLKALEEKSYETEAHTRRMQEVAQEVGEELRLPDAELQRLRLLITLHDIGKINISEEMLTRSGPLTPDEWEIMKRHPEVGSRIARATGEFAHVADDILAHHERWDGKGYPQGLKGREVPLLARITAIADAYEVMTNGRPYKAAMSREEVVRELKRCAGTQFDPELVAVLVGILERGQSGR